jgi:hypothetical protein
VKIFFNLAPKKSVSGEKIFEFGAKTSALAVPVRPGRQASGVVVQLEPIRRISFGSKLRTQIYPGSNPTIVKMVKQRNNPA